VAKKFPDVEIDEVLTRLEKYGNDGIFYTNLKDSLKKNFIKIKISEFKLKDILVFLDENGLVQRIPFEDKSSFHDLTLYRITDKGQELIKKFERDSSEKWKKNTYPANIVCQNCGYFYEVRIDYALKIKDWAKEQRCYNCAHKATFVTKTDS
jgi:DNA-binding PadR family transcriptional regulator